VLYGIGAAGKQGKVTVVEQALAPVYASSSAPAPLDAAHIYATAAPGVVDITATGHDSSFHGFPFAPPSRETALGTGFVVDSRGEIVTASHVVAGASSITARLAGGTVRSAKVLGMDRSTDVALLSIDPSRLTLHSLPLGRSGALAVGDPLAVMGDPFGYSRSLSTGVVSSLHRMIDAPDGFTIGDAIQTDAPINPGNSGGPLLNAHGQVVGIADQIATGQSGGDAFAGVGFAVPIDDVRAELPQLARGAHVAHAYLGIGLAQTAERNGALVASVAPGSPAAAAGLRRRDLVTAVDGTPVHGPNGLVSAVTAHRPGDKLTLTVKSRSSTSTLSATLGSQPSRG
jgi:S1-C subfamily serine protease